MTQPDTLPVVKVLSVVGAGRSGTTVLASVLSEVPGFCGVGELRWLWERGVREGRPCGCGAQPVECPVWGPVVRRTLAVAPGSDDAARLAAIVDAQHELARRRALPRLLRRGGARSDDWPELRMVGRATEEACVALAELTGTRVLVDTSKRALDAAVVEGLSSVDHFVLHVVRDPRAVAHSWRRRKSTTVGERTWTMGTRSVPGSVRKWTYNSLAAETLRRRIPDARWHSLRYEDFAASPRQVIADVVRFVGEDGTPPWIDDRTVRLGPNHIVIGNPSRFTTGDVRIREDDEWRRRMPRRDQWLVGVLTAPLRLRYGYWARS